VQLPIRPGYQLNVWVANFEVSKFVSTFFLVNCSFYVFNILHLASALFREAVRIQGVPSVHLFFFSFVCVLLNYLIKWDTKVKL